MELKHLLCIASLATTGIALAQAQTTLKTQLTKAPTPARHTNLQRQLPFVDARNMTVVLMYAPPDAAPQPLGSGVWIGKHGYVATCQHVIANRSGPFKIGVPLDTYISEQIVISSSGTLFGAELVDSDPDTDVAIFKTDTTPDQARPQVNLAFSGPGKPPVSVTPQVPLIPKGATLSSDLPRLGETLLLAGFPLGENILVLQTGAATGFIPFPTARPSSPGPTRLRIMLSLVSNPGNSGGPVLDASILGLAVEWGALHSAPKIKKLPGERHREHVVSFAEEAKYIAASSEPLGSVAAVLVDTGLRPEECFRLRWESITWSNGRHGTLLVTHGKTAAARRVLPMTPRVRRIVETRWANVVKPLEGWVWPASTRSGHIEPSSLKKQHCKVLKLSKVRPFVLYSLRHTFLTRLGESGCDTWTLARIAGHSSIAISARYVHPSHDAVLAAIDKLGGHKIGHNEVG